MIAMQYVPLAARTLKLLPTFRQHMLHMGAGITGEIGELIDAAKKVAVYGKPIDHINNTEEVGDTLWYIANLVPVLNVGPGFMQRGLDRGYEKGLQMQQQMNFHSDLNFIEAILQFNKQTATFAADFGRIDEGEFVGSAGAAMLIENLSGTVGMICGILGVDPSIAMQRNIEKLAKRYGDKYSDVAALNRDLGAERVALEGGSNSEILEGTFDPVLEDGDHPGGSLNTTASVTAQPSPTSTPIINTLEDDTPLAGGGCPVDGPCEGCQ